jgi:hypothetical protein
VEVRSEHEDGRGGLRERQREEEDGKCWGKPVRFVDHARTLQEVCSTSTNKNSKYSTLSA